MFARYVEVFEAHPMDVSRAKEQEEGTSRIGAARRNRTTPGSVVTLRGLPYRYRHSTGTGNKNKKMF